MTQIKRVFFLSLGFLFLALGILGVFLPLLPTTPFLLLASFCFSKASRRFQDWLHDHPRYGPILKEWHQERVIRPKAKALAISMILVSFSFPVFVLDLHIALKFMLVIMELALIIFFLSCKSYPRAKETSIERI